jgi:hypothetical protein
MSDTNTVSPLRQRVIEDMAARKLNPHTQRGHIYSCMAARSWRRSVTRNNDLAPEHHLLFPSRGQREPCPVYP